MRRRTQTRWPMKAQGYPPPCLACTLPPPYPKVHTGLGAYCPKPVTPRTKDLTPVTRSAMIDLRRANDPDTNEQ